MAGRNSSVDSSEPHNGLKAARCAGPRPGLLGRNGDGGLVSLTSLSIPERPAQLLITRRAAERLRNLALLANKIYIVGLYAAVDAIFKLRGELCDAKVILFAGNGAACAALTKDAAGNRLAVALVCTV